jgi:hypothetical protein
MATIYQKNFTDTFPFSNTNVTILLAASTALPWTVPGTPDQIYRAHFSVSSTADVWVSNNGTATLPTAGTVTSEAYQERIDQNCNRYVKGGDVLSFIGIDTTSVGVSLLQVQPIT